MAVRLALMEFRCHLQGRAEYESAGLVTDSGADLSPIGAGPVMCSEFRKKTVSLGPCGDQPLQFDPMIVGDEYDVVHVEEVARQSELLN